MRTLLDPRLAARITVIALITFRVSAQQADIMPPGAIAKPGFTQASGVVLTRLTKRQLKAWVSILEIVLARNTEGSPTYPVLHGLYRRVDSSGHVVQIEVSTQRATLCAVGLCRIESPAQRAQEDVILIRLNLLNKMSSGQPKSCWVSQSRELRHTSQSGRAGSRHRAPGPIMGPASSLPASSHKRIGRHSI